MGSIAPAVKFDADGSGPSGDEVGTVERETRKIVNDVMTHLNASWMDWTPTYVYTGSGPNTAITIGRYRVQGTTVHFNLSCIKTDTAQLSAATALTITPPVRPKFIQACIPIKAIQLVHGTYSNPLAYISANTDSEAASIIRFRGWTTLGTGAYTLELAGFYEIA
uniref:Uncharacterized protein n=2 Tax=viral metagenome TaxID=1070528 RepID=A0A6M3XPQ5_9ZZZZ